MQQVRNLLPTAEPHGLERVMSSSLISSILAACFSVALCLAGSVICIKLFARARRTTGRVRLYWLSLAGLSGGSTFWSVHFLVAIAAQLPVELSNGIANAIYSLSFAVLTVTAGLAIATQKEKSLLIEIGGAVVGIGIVGTHVLSLAAFSPMLFNDISPALLLVAITLACFFGSIATNRIGRPVSRFCKWGGAASLILAIAFCYGLGISTVDKSVYETANVPGLAQIMTIVLIAGSIITSAFIAYLIDEHSDDQGSTVPEQVSVLDPLTGLVTRKGFENQISRASGKLHDDTAKMAVVVIDINQFKEINGVHGQDAGDTVLYSLASRLSSNLGKNEFVGRFSGDRFLAFKHPVYSRTEARKFCQRLCDVMRTPVNWNDEVLTVGSSAGAALFPSDARQPIQLIELADLAAQRAKSADQQSVAFYDPTLDENNRTRDALAIDLRSAVANNELELHYQRQNDADSRELTGFEALMRWNHPVHGQISPTVFIPIAEDTGLINEMGKWALQSACQEAAQWSRPLTVAVNVAAAQLASTQFPSEVKDILASTGFAAKRLEIEITESGLIHDQQHTLSILNELKSLGVKLAMDDYGTGYSSLSMLQAFPFDKIKIDREFITYLGSSRHSAAIVRATMALSASLDLPVLAEGVETESQLKYLQQTGCKSVQGFLFGKPLTVLELRDLVNSTTSSTKNHAA